MILSELIRRGRGEQDPRRHAAPHPRAVPARAVDPLRHPARAARQRGHPAGPTQDPGQPQPVHLLQAGDHLDRHAEERRPLPPPPRGHPLGRGGHRRVPQPRQPGHAQQPARPGAGAPHRGAAPHQRHAAQRRPGQLRRADPPARPDRHRRPRATSRADDIEHLYVRRHKAHAGGRRRGRLPVGRPQAAAPDPVVPTPPEAGAVRRARRHLDPSGRRARARHRARARACSRGRCSRRPSRAITRLSRRSSSDARRSRRRRQRRADAPVERDAEDAALEALLERALADRRRHLVEARTRWSSSSRRSASAHARPTRVVVFSERIATLDWLARTVPERLGPASRSRSGCCTAASPTSSRWTSSRSSASATPTVRLLFTGDMASEGVNLHRAVPPPHPLRPALVAHHDRAAQRPHRPLRPGARRPTSGRSSKRPTIHA